MDLKPITLIGKLVSLVPLGFEHTDDLASFAGDDSIWIYMRYGVVDNPEKMRGFIKYLLDAQARGTDLPFAVVHNPSGKAIGMTRYMNIEPPNRSLEIGGTWYAVQHQRTGVNTECKFLLLQHAFEVQGCIRVQIKTDSRNIQSQRAIERIGAVREGILRDHMILPDGTIRSSVYYSVLEREWPEVKQRLINLMNRS